MATNQEQEDGNKPIIKEAKIGRNDPCPCGSLKNIKDVVGEIRTHNI